MHEIAEEHCEYDREGGDVDTGLLDVTRMAMVVYTESFRCVSDGGLRFDILSSLEAAACTQHDQLTTYPMLINNMK